MVKGPNLRDDLPRYPPLLQLVRVTTATIPGPSGGASAGAGTGAVPPAILYIASAQQLRTDTLSPRDREPCLVVDVNGDGLSAGYYIARLAGSYQSLPVFEVATTSSTSGSSTPGLQGPAGSSGLLPGLTPTQLSTLNASLTPTQLSNLNNLDACQLQVLMQLPIVNIQMLTTDLLQTPLANLIDRLEYTPLLQIVTQIPRTQVVVVSSAFPQLYQLINQVLTPAQVITLLTGLTSQQLGTLLGLTPAQLQTVAQLTAGQISTLTNLTPARVTTLVGQLTPSQIALLLTSLTIFQLQQLLNNLVPFQIGQLLQAVAPAQIAQLMANLNPAQLAALMAQPPAMIAALVNGLAMGDLIQFLNLITRPPAPILGNQGYFPSVPSIGGQPSSTPSSTPQGYSPIVIDNNTGKLWVNKSGMWTDVAVPSSKSITEGMLSTPGGSYVPGGYHQIAGTARYYYTGVFQDGRAPSTTLTLATNTALAIPWLCNRTGVIDTIFFKVSTAATTGKLNLNLFANTSPTNLYPAARLSNNGEVTIQANNTVVSYTGLAIPVVAGTMYHWGISVSVTTGSPTISAWPQVGGYIALLGNTGVMDPDAYYRVGASTYANPLADPFPAGIAIAATATAIPAIGVRYLS